MAITLYYKTGRIWVDYCFTSDAVEAVEWLIRNGIINPADYRKAVIEYDCDKGINWYDNTAKDHYPLKLFGSLSSRHVGEIWCSGVTAGYSGEGPYGTERILKMMGFDVDLETEKRIDSKENNNPHVFIILNK